MNITASFNLSSELFISKDKYFLFNVEVPRGGGGVCAPLIPENNALISPSPCK